MSTSLPREPGIPWSWSIITRYLGLGGLLPTSIPSLLYCPHMGHSSPESCSKHLLVFPLMPTLRDRPHSPCPRPPSFCHAGALPSLPAPPSATSPPKPVQGEAPPAEPEAQSAPRPECPGNGCRFSNTTKRAGSSVVASETAAGPPRLCSGSPDKPLSHTASCSSAAGGGGRCSHGGCYGYCQGCSWTYRCQSPGQNCQHCPSTCQWQQPTPASLWKSQ